MSVTVNLNVSGVREFELALSRFDKQMQSQIQGKLAGWAETTRVEAQRLVPVRTGYLQSTIYSKAHEWQMEVGAQAAYAAAVEFGSRRAQAKPYLTPAIERHLPELEQVLLQAIDTAKLEANL
jgi:hypothetical protein